MAQKIGLVDRLGTLEDAVAHAAELSGLKKGEKFDRMILPKPTSPLESLFGPIDNEAGIDGRSRGSFAAGLKALSPELVQQLQAAELVNLLSRDPRLTLLPFQIRVK
jgi:protease-4